MVPTSTRGQMPIDFLTGMAVFFVVVGFVLLFVPDLLTPTAGGQETALVADRVGTQLVEFHLGDPGTTTLSTCALWFFNQSGANPCATFDTSATLTDQVGIDDSYGMNVTLRRDVGGDSAREILCADSGSVVPCSSGGSQLAVGPPPSASDASVATARRHVSLDDTDAVLQVEVW
ncbi:MULTISPECIES: DUF7287 family protein [Haloarcula]|uniref:Uncharacterized protein n=1 Tax=Haloarcula pellucida TaxID=1427151 RepID=A0A830GJ62_9EURY|nr:MULTISPECIES: hypothetical protein [Halomicroarcula]MBX0348613.1 hypothetical protein [Halomicroarcula pellucida]MDS0278416.1 hypothetical protein [Halomicroarcula sp. S1AR25-4]GGN92573.1 hypothetical protein GCM10009030_16970 [Halomicroarcula pellucida]